MGDDRDEVSLDASPLQLPSFLSISIYRSVEINVRKTSTGKKIRRREKQGNETELTLLKQIRPKFSGTLLSTAPPPTTPSPRSSEIHPQLQLSSGVSLPGRAKDFFLEVMMVAGRDMKTDRKARAPVPWSWLAGSFSIPCQTKLCSLVALLLLLRLRRASTQSRMT